MPDWLLRNWNCNFEKPHVIQKIIYFTLLTEAFLFPKFAMQRFQNFLRNQTEHINTEGTKNRIHKHQQARLGQKLHRLTENEGGRTRF